MIPDDDIERALRADPTNNPANQPCWPIDFSPKEQEKYRKSARAALAAIHYEELLAVMEAARQMTKHNKAAQIFLGNVIATYDAARAPREKPGDPT